ncbi:hypothetical protein GCM10020331_000210 [Ectobacillus funiculus]
MQELVNEDVPEYHAEYRTLVSRLSSPIHKILALLITTPIVAALCIAAPTTGEKIPNAPSKMAAPLITNVAIKIFV